MRKNIWAALAGLLYLIAFFALPFYKVGISFVSVGISGAQVIEACPLILLLAVCGIAMIVVALLADNRGLGLIVGGVSLVVTLIFAFAAKGSILSYGLDRFVSVSSMGGVGSILNALLHFGAGLWICLALCAGYMLLVLFFGAQFGRKPVRRDDDFLSGPSMF